MDPILNALLEAVNRGGAAVGVVMTIMWWFTNAERKELQTTHIASIGTLLTAMNDQKNAMTSLTQVLMGREPQPRRTE